jgi:hypothetical protein
VRQGRSNAADSLVNGVLERGTPCDRPFRRGVACVALRRIGATGATVRVVSESGTINIAHAPQALLPWNRRTSGGLSRCVPPRKSTSCGPHRDVGGPGFLPLPGPFPFIWI